MTPRKLAALLPDIPRWVEARDLLLGGRCELFGTSESAFAVRDPDTGSVVVVGAPALEVISAATENVGGGNLVCLQEHAAWVSKALPGWTSTRCMIHVLTHPEALPEASNADVRFLEPSLIPQLAIDEELRGELESGAQGSKIAAARVDNQPAAFCYAGSITESLWDVSIDTVASHRRKGLAGHCAAFMVRHMWQQGRDPVWQSDAANPASWKLAAKLGFRLVDEMTLFEP